MHPHRHHRHHMMKGFLSFLVMWMISKQDMTGAEVTEEIQRRRGHRPSPGTIYPVLKYLTENGLLKVDENKKYSLTKKGKEELDMSLNHFFDTFCDIDDMRERCRCGRH